MSWLIKRSKGADAVGWALAIAFAAVLGVIWWRVTTLGTQLAASNEARSQLAQQVQSLGGTPVAGPSGAPGVSITGPPGPEGPSGAPGRDAPTPNLTAIASQAAALIHPSPGPSGPQGVQGVPGPRSTVPGPAGSPGAAGPSGAAGQPPAGWTYTDPAGDTYTCTRVADFDPSNPQYQCALTSTPSPSPSPSSTPSATTTTAPPKASGRTRPHTIVAATEPK